MEMLGRHFFKFSMLIGTPASAAELYRLQQPGEQVNESRPLESYLHVWRTEAAQGVAPRPDAVSAPYDVHFVLNETHYGINCTSLADVT